MSKLIQRFRALLLRGKRYRRVRVAGDYVLLTEPQARRFEQLQDQERRRL